MPNAKEAAARCLPVPLQREREDLRCCRVMFFFFKSFVAGYITAGISSKPSTTLGWKTHEALWPIYLFGRFGETRCCICSAEVLTQAERRLFRWWSICLRREIFGERSTILWRIYRIQFTDRSDFVHRSQRPQDAWKKPSLFLHFKLMDTKQQPAVILRLFFFFSTSPEQLHWEISVPFYF